MNILINKELHNYLQTIIIDTIEFGSAMKGRQTEQSDTDLLHIVQPHKCLVSSPIYTNHLLQYKEEDLGLHVDHIYCTSIQFVENLFNAESMINHEILRAGALKNTHLAWLETYASAFDCFKTYRGYLGFCNRDLKDCSKMFSDKRKAYKKLEFTKDALEYVNQHYPFDLIEINPDIVKLPYQEFSVELSKYMKMVIEVRENLRKDLDAGKMPYSVDADAFIKISSELGKPSLLPDNDFSDIMLSFYYKAMVLNEYK